jgi:ribosomal protein L15
MDIDDYDERSSGSHSIIGPGMGSGAGAGGGGGNAGIRFDTGAGHSAVPVSIPVYVRKFTLGFIIYALF